MKPLIKWAGGKSKLLPIIGPPIVATLKKSNGCFVEPFMGGGSVSLYVAEHSKSPMRLFDALLELVNFWNQVLLQPVRVFDVVERLFSDCSEKQYYNIRSVAPDMLNLTARAARFYYLNQLGFNGLYRLNKKGEFNVPFGKRKKPPKLDREHWIAVGNALAAASCVVRKSYFQTLSFHTRPGDVVYADPPYHNTFTAYTGHPFTQDDQISLANTLKAAHDRGVTVFASNADTSLIRSLYSWARIEVAEEPRAINANGAGRGNVPCVFIRTD